MNIYYLLDSSTLQTLVPDFSIDTATRTFIDSTAAICTDIYTFNTFAFCNYYHYLPFSVGQTFLN